MAGEEGIEPSYTGSKPVALPLDYSPTLFPRDAFFMASRQSASCLRVSSSEESCCTAIRFNSNAQSTKSCRAAPRRGLFLSTESAVSSFAVWKIPELIPFGCGTLPETVQNLPVLSTRTAPHSEMALANKLSISFFMISPFILCVKAGGAGRTRTYEVRRRQGYSLLQLPLCDYPVERTMGLEPIPVAWKASMLPLNTTPALII